MRVLSVGQNLSGGHYDRHKEKYDWSGSVASRCYFDDWSAYHFEFKTGSHGCQPSCQPGVVGGWQYASGTAAATAEARHQAGLGLGEDSVRSFHSRARILTTECMRGAPLWFHKV